MECLDPSFGQMPVEIGNGEAQRAHGIRLGDQVGDRPQAKFVAFQAGLEKGPPCVNKVVRGLVEDAKMGSPRHFAEIANAGLARGIGGTEPPGIRVGTHGARTPGLWFAVDFEPTRQDFTKVASANQRLKQSTTVHDFASNS